MLTKAITYTNFNGEKVTKNFYFNITKAELAMRELESDGTWSQTLKNIQGSDKGSVVMPEFKKIIKWTYGEKSADGESFIKSDEAWSRFENSEPWSELIMELLSDAGVAADFINGVLPADIAARNLEAQAVNGFRPGVSPERLQPVAPTEPAPVVGSGGAAYQGNVSGNPEPVLPIQTNRYPDQAEPQHQFQSPIVQTEAPIQQQSTPREDPIIPYQQ